MYSRRIIRYLRYSFDGLEVVEQSLRVFSKYNRRALREARLREQAVFKFEFSHLKNPALLPLS